MALLNEWEMLNVEEGGASNQGARKRWFGALKVYISIQELVWRAK
jgi:hypothetical protein